MHWLELKLTWKNWTSSDKGNWLGIPPSSGSCIEKRVNAYNLLKGTVA
jgi:hypothetical protein